jgi:hypothetical protein
MSQDIEADNECNFITPTRTFTSVLYLKGTTTMRQRISFQKANNEEFHISQKVDHIQKQHEADVQIPIPSPEIRQVVQREINYNGIIITTVLFIILFICYIYYDRVYWH